MQQCPYYMSLGVSYDEYWHGDYTRLPYYRKAYALKREEKNQQLWLQGLYFRIAVLSAFTEDTKYPDEPLPITEDAFKEQEERRKQTEIDNARAYMEVAMHNINKKRREQKEAGSDG